MRRFCQRCRQWRNLLAEAPGTPTHCDPCLKAIAEQSPTAAQVARQQRAQLLRRQCINGLLAWLEVYKQQLGCSRCEEADPSCLDCCPVDPAAKPHAILGLIQKRVPVEALKKELEKCVVICSNCYRKQRGQLREDQAGARAVRPDTLDTLVRRRRSMIATLLQLDTAIAEACRKPGPEQIADLDE